MHWILQDRLQQETAYTSLREALERLGLPFSEHKVVPFVGDLIPEPQIDANKVICIGAYSMRHVAKKHAWEPGVCDLEPHDFTVQLSHWGEHMLNHDSTVGPLKDIEIGERRRFVRPILDSKSFSGGVMDHYEWEDFKQKILNLTEKELTFSAITPDTIVQSSPLKTIYGEYRFFVVGGKPITASQYKVGDRVLYDDDVPEVYWDFVRDMIAIWQPDEAFVIDVASVPDDGGKYRGIKIVEINTLNSAGFYAADLQKLVIALEDHFD